LRADVIHQLHISHAEIDAVAEREAKEAERRESLFRGGRPPLSVRGRTVLVVDDGLATGSTMSAAIYALKSQKPERIVLAIPVAPRETCERLRQEVNELYCLSMPSPFRAVGEWYDDFEQVGDEEVIELLQAAEARRLVPAG
jgi:putative phosphoribosyl transferase